MTTSPPINRVKKKLQAGELVLCMGINQMRSADAPILAAACGFDAIYVDLEHSTTSLETAAMLCVAALNGGITPIARVPSHESFHAARMLDAGCQGVMVPHVQTEAEARAIVDKLRFTPLGHRSAFGTGAGLGYRAMPQAEINRFLNEQELVIAMLETPLGVENAEAIAAVPGIDMLHIGSLDLSNEMGIPAQYRNPRMWAAYERVAAACKSQGKAMGVGGARNDLELQADLIRLGVRYLTPGSDVSYMAIAARASATALRAIKV